MDQVFKERHLTKLTNGNFYGLALVMSDTKKNVNGRIIKHSDKGIRNISAKLGAMVGKVCGEINPDRKTADSIHINNAVGILKGFCVKSVGGDIHVHVEITPSPELLRLQEHVCNHMFTCCSSLTYVAPDEYILNNIFTVNAVPILGYDFPMSGPYPANFLEGVTSFTPL